MQPPPFSLESINETDPVEEDAHAQISVGELEESKEVEMVEMADEEFEQTTLEGDVLEFSQDARKWEADHSMRKMVYQPERTVIADAFSRKLLQSIQKIKSEKSRPIESCLSEVIDLLPAPEPHGDD